MALNTHPEKKPLFTPEELRMIMIGLSILSLGFAIAAIGFVLLLQK